ncbi:MAG: class I SAM-dependent methyltransferase [Proteobacteria bacterium]|nr:class I SAM-dependent methyltransferase [Pseudomonadota bacterium]
MRWPALNVSKPPDAATEPTRFAFGKNWQRFLKHVDEERIRTAEQSLRNMLGLESLEGRSFLDAGCGSGLFSLAARRLGASVHSFDYDAESVACTAELRRRYFPGDDNWIVAQGDVLDDAYVKSLGRFDVVYSWGVLHHTGRMWGGVEAVASCVEPGGHLFIALYNDQGWISGYWSWVKRVYNRGALFRAAVVAFHSPYLVGLRLIVRWGRGDFPLKRGMSLWHDLLDWLGGFPFETAKPKDVVAFARARGFADTKVVTCGRRHGCNEFVFRREDAQH